MEDDEGDETTCPSIRKRLPGQMPTRPRRLQHHHPTRSLGFCSKTTRISPLQKANSSGVSATLSYRAVARRHCVGREHKEMESRLERDEDEDEDDDVCDNGNECRSLVDSGITTLEVGFSSSCTDDKLETKFLCFTTDEGLELLGLFRQNMIRRARTQHSSSTKCDTSYLCPSTKASLAEMTDTRFLSGS